MRESTRREHITSGGDGAVQTDHAHTSNGGDGAKYVPNARRAPGGDGVAFRTPIEAPTDRIVDGRGGIAIPAARTDGAFRDSARIPRGGAPESKRFPPVIQFLTDVHPSVRQQLKEVCMQSHRQGCDLQEVCRNLYLYAQSEGYDLTLGVQQVFSTKMPSFQNQTIQSALLLADVRPLAKAAASPPDSRG